MVDGAGDRVGTKTAMVDSQAELVVRPGPFQLAYCSLLPAFFLFVGVGAILTPRQRDFGLICLAAAVLALAYIFGMRVEVTSEALTKVFFLGLWRRTIPRTMAGVGRHRESNRNPSGGSSWTVVDFQRDGKTVFSMTPGWVWRNRDVTAVVDSVSKARR